VVYVVPVEGVIDLGLAPFITRVLDEAQGESAAAVILGINTFGGRVDAAVLIRDALLRTPVRTIAFVNKRAISAGALIGLAATTIAIAEGGTIGAATPVTIGAPGGPAQPVEEKTVSYMRKEFRATAEARKRPPLLAEAMVDADVEVPGLSEKGKLLTLTTDEALEHKVADLRADTLTALLDAVDLGDAEIRRLPQTWAETLVRILTHPVLSSLLLSIGVLGLIVEVQTPGVGLPGGLGLACSRPSSSEPRESPCFSSSRQIRAGPRSAMWRWPSHSSPRASRYPAGMRRAAHRAPDSGSRGASCSSGMRHSSSGRRSKAKPCGS